MSQESQEKPGGNTKTPRPANQLYRWFFTLPYTCITASQLSQDLHSMGCKMFRFQGEEGEGGFKHWQGCFTLKRKEYFSTVKNYFPNQIHLEQCMDWHASYNYCGKKETQIEGPYDENSKFLNLIETLYPWQEKIRNACLGIPDDRKINWVYDEKGGKGKTQFCKYMAAKHSAIILNNGRKNDIVYAMGDCPKIVMFNLSRSNEEHFNYDALEAIKDGLIMSSKYESKMLIFNSPHVYVFANFMPNLEAMSSDRWNIITLK